jgi:hypothetical protein
MITSILPTDKMIKKQDLRTAKLRGGYSLDIVTNRCTRLSAIVSKPSSWIKRKQELLTAELWSAYGPVIATNQGALSAVRSLSTAATGERAKPLHHILEMHTRA